MANYVTAEDLKKHFPEKRLIQLAADLSTQNTWADAQVQANFDAAIESAEAEVDAILSQRFETPVSPAPARLAMAAGILAVWHLFSRKQEISAAWEKQRDRQIDYLERVSAEELGLGGGGGTEAPTVMSTADESGGAGLVFGGGGLALF